MDVRRMIEHPRIRSIARDDEFHRLRASLEFSYETQGGGKEGEGEEDGKISRLYRFVFHGKRETLCNE